MLYTFVKHLEIAGGRKWKARIAQWRRKSRKSKESLVGLMRDYASKTKDDERDMLFKWYRNARMDYNVRRDSKLEHQLYGRRPEVKKAHQSRKVARKVFKRHHPDVDMRGLEVDHIDCNNRNNHISNLQLLTPAQHKKKRCSRRKRKGLRVPVNVAHPSKWKRAYKKLRDELRATNAPWSFRSTERLVKAYEASGGELEDP